MCLTIVAPPTGVLRLGMTIHCPVLGQYLSTVYVCRNCFIKQWQCLVIILQRIINNDVYEVFKNPSSFYKYLIGISQVSPIPTRKATYEDVFSSHCTSREPSRAYSRLQLLPAVLSHIIYLHSLEGSCTVRGLGYEQGLGAGPAPEGFNAPGHNWPHTEAVLGPAVHATHSQLHYSHKPPLPSEYILIIKSNPLPQPDFVIDC